MGRVKELLMEKIEKVWADVESGTIELQEAINRLVDLGVDRNDAIHDAYEAYPERYVEKEI